MADQIPTRTLGRTGLEVGRLGFGAMEIRGEPRGRATTDREAEEVLNNVLTAGINYVDTANDYGLSEERIGRSIASRRSMCNPPNARFYGWCATTPRKARITTSTA